MKKLSVVFRQHWDLGLSFACPFLVLGLAYALFGVYPFGEKTILISDMAGQYLDFYSELYRMVTEGRSLFFSWHAGLGHNFVGIIAYYLASPFSAIIFLFSQEQLPEALFLMTLLKIGTAGLTFALFARHAFRGPRAAVLAFALLYALMAYSIVYSFNIMWLDGVILLPLVLLGIEKLHRHNKLLLLGASLWLMFVANFYIAYMIGLFAFLYFLSSYGLHYSYRNWRLLLAKLGAFLFAALAAAGCAAFLLIPAYFALEHSPNPFVFSQLLKLKFNFPLFDLLSKLPTGAYDDLRNSLPNVAAGTLTLLLLPIFFSSPRHPLEAKLIYLALIAFFLLSFSLYNLNIAWHAFDIPDWFPYRYSFLFSFLLIAIAFRAYLALEPSDVPRLVKSYGALVTIVILLQKFAYPYLSPLVILTNLTVLTLYLGILVLTLRHPTRRRVLSALLILVILIETLFGSWYLIRRLNSQFLYAERQEYRQTMSSLQLFTGGIQERDPGVYRLERTAGRTHNDALNLGYPGVAHFSSMANGNLHSLLRQLGFAVWANNKVLSYSGSTLVTDSLLGVKYKIASQSPGFGYVKRLSAGDLGAPPALELQLYENRFSLPLGFMASAKLGELARYLPDNSSDLANPFELQNILLNLCRGISPGSPDYTSYFTPLKPDSVLLENLTATATAYERALPAQDAFIHFVITDPPGGRPLYAYLPPGTVHVQVLANDNDLGKYAAAHRIVDLGTPSPGQPLKLTFKLLKNTHPFTPTPLYALDTAAFTRAVEDLSERGMENIRLTSTTVTGTVTAHEGELLFTTVPYDPGWKAYVDGREVPITPIAQAFIALDLPPGTHHVRLEFFPRGLTTGLGVTAATGALLLLLAFRSRFSHSRLGRPLFNARSRQPSESYNAPDIGKKRA